MPVQYEDETKKELISNGRIVIIGIELHKVYSLQRLLHYRVNHDVNERHLSFRLAYFDESLFDISRPQEKNANTLMNGMSIVEYSIMKVSGTNVKLNISQTSVCIGLGI